MQINLLGRTMTAAAALALAFAVTPVTIGTDHGLVLEASKAFAKDGSDDSGSSGKGSGGDNSGSGKSGSGSDRGDDSGRGRGGDDRGDDRSSGRGSDDDRSSGRDDDRGRGGDDDHADDHGDRGGETQSSDDRRGRGRDEDRAARDDDGLQPSAGGSAGSGPLRAIKVERSAGGIEIVYSNNVKEEIEAGRYELKDASGRTVAQRRATQSDFDRIRANLRLSGLQMPAAGNGGTALPVGSQARSVEISGGSIEVRYATGWKEEVEGSRYELKDPNNNTVVERPATAADRDRMLALAGG